jgi:hypothetical protein
LKTNSEAQFSINPILNDKIIKKEKPVYKKEPKKKKEQLKE